MSSFLEIEMLQEEAQQLTGKRNYNAAEQKYSLIIQHLTKQLPELEGDELEKLKGLLSNAYNDRGLVKYFEVNFYDAINDYSSALEFNPRLTAAYYNRGLICYRLGNYSDAINDMTSALNLDPEFTSAKECKKQSEIDELLKRQSTSENVSLQELQEPIES